MTMAERVAMAVQGVRFPLHEAFPATALLGPYRQEGLESSRLALSIGAADAQRLIEALRGGYAMHSRAIQVLDQAVYALGGQIVAVRLHTLQPGLLHAAILIRTPLDQVALPLALGSALTVAVRCGVPLLVDDGLLSSTHVRHAQPWQSWGRASLNDA